MSLDLRTFEILTTPAFVVDQAVDILKGRTLTSGIFREPMFATSTGFARSVAVEIELSLFSQSRVTSTLTEFISFWDLSSIERKQLDELSGGWLRILMLSLFFQANLHCEELIIVNGFRFIAPDRLYRLLRQLATVWSGQVWVFGSDLENRREQNLTIANCKLDEIINR